MNNYYTPVQECEGTVVARKEALVFTVHIAIAPNLTQLCVRVNYWHRLYYNMAEPQRKPKSQLKLRQVISNIDPQ